MTRRLLLTYLTITAIALGAVVVPLGRIYAERERDQLYHEIERDAVTVGSLAEDALELGTIPSIGPVLAEYSDRTGGRIVVVDRDGISVADSEAPDAPRRDFSTRPEISTALEGRREIGTRGSETLGSSFVYVSVPVASGGAVYGAVRITFPTASLDERVRDAWMRLATLVIAVLCVVAVVGLLLARSVTKPVLALEEAAGRIADGDLTARVGTDRGPPELRLLATTFNGTAERLEQLVTAQSRFVADAAHQLRSPLSAVRLRLENLEPHLPLSERRKLEAAEDELTRLSRIVDGLLLLARSGTRSAPVTPTDLSAAISDRAAAWAEVAANQDVRVEANAGKPVVVRAQEGAVEQILDNLVSNALAASPAGSVIQLEAGQDDQFGFLQVTDRGSGLGEADRERAFERFWRGSSLTPGSGLGLAIVRDLARLHGGDALLAQGADGVGTVARVRLPLAREPRGMTHVTRREPDA